ncbi:polypeptide N-acetylgalactosaminyltransferase 11-like [Gigantopelta aegis]|uniref:polypeptide N-acetylgalactosaminyltransferase 11-like n=1 Tax=Gigantopelta aegis TaxID=1735272 RepID=UPI001B88C62B|nr:polypeptide N-acetylgalactosaminyltransferase 11-like [Gigantopelta aegis]XP_041367351.1 polypeptide N-acetylgalactosaminyltransferase 11-like [Gigantopelta aegis]XP_041367352.1 polypeptide N-acetylgalactosaminyltransferase 11-like [Gigantopelta aegis]
MIGWVSFTVAVLSSVLWLALSGHGEWWKMPSLWDMVGDSSHSENITERLDLQNYDLVTVYKMGIIEDTSDEKSHIEGFRKHAFNELVSERLGFHRPIPDTRNTLCKQQQYPPDLPKASIIICFYNEAWSTLLRTVHTIIDRTPPNLLEEIILIDDFSDMGTLWVNMCVLYQLSSDCKLMTIIKSLYDSLLCEIFQYMGGVYLSGKVLGQGVMSYSYFMIY